MDPVLSCSGLTKRFGGLVALDSLELDVQSGEIVGLIGPNGSGKTTFFNVLTGIYPCDGGTVAFLGRDITGFSPQQVYRAGIARTFQRSRLCLSLSIFDNIAMGDHKNLSGGLALNLFGRRRLRAEVERTYGAARALLHRFDAPLADRMFEPAGGLPMIDRRRIEICRALISQPRLLLLDEPSAGMTHDETRQLMDDILAMRRQIEGLTIILIEHEMGVIERVTERCVVLNFGQQIAAGSYQQVARERAVQEAYLGIE